MHDKLVKQLRNSEHCGECPYDTDCKDFDSCLLDLLAADAIEDMGKRISRLEKELQERPVVDHKEHLTPCNLCSNDYNQEIAVNAVRYHTSGLCSRTVVEARYCPNCDRRLAGTA